MAVPVVMPRLGESVVEGTVAIWLKKPGDDVAEFEALLEVVTDKVDTEIPSPAAGKLLKIMIPEGATTQVGSVLAWIGENGEEGMEGNLGAKSINHNSVLVSHADQKRVVRSGRDPVLGYISPVVAKMAQEYQIDLGLIRGSGEKGRITKRDVQVFIAMQMKTRSELPPWDLPADGDLFRPRELTFPGQPAGAQPLDLSYNPPEAAPVVPLDLNDEFLPLTSMRRSIAAAMVLSKQSVPHVTTIMEADVSRITAHRSVCQAEFERQGVHLTYSAYFGSAVVQALRAHPKVNSSWVENGIQLYRRIHLGFAVALGKDGLIVPVIRDADELSLLELARGLNDLARRGRDRKLKPDEVKGGTFTITNHGTGGSLFATPVINPPQCGILGVGAIQKRVVVIDDMIAIRPMIYLSFTFDHRILDGRAADEFLAAVKGALDNWVG
jgi:2-oxoglutarate dehydrogenase E2 component (dihydrolipoamide succinyltransferase)